MCLECFSRVFGQGLEGSMVSLSLRKGHFTWLHPGYSARLKIWQVPAYKMDPQFFLDTTFLDVQFLKVRGFCHIFFYQNAFGPDFFGHKNVLEPK